MNTTRLGNRKNKQEHQTRTSRFLYHQRYHNQTSGWHKVCLYIYFTLTVIIIISNAALIVWILTMMKFSVKEVQQAGQLFEGTIMGRQVWFLQDIFAPQLLSPHNNCLTVHSAAGVELKVTGNFKNRPTQINVNPLNVNIFCDQIMIKNSLGSLVLLIGEQSKLKAEYLQINYTSKVNMNQSMQTPLIQSRAGSGLQIESLSRKIFIRGPLKAEVHSRLGNMSLSSFKRLYVRSKSGNIIFKASKVRMDKMKTILPTKRGKSYPGIMQLCSCHNGRLFVSNISGPCSAHDSICEKTELQI